MQDRQKIDLKQVGVIMDAAGIPGVSIATISGDEKPSTMVLGKGTNSQTSITPETVFGAASLSKPLFAYLVLKLIQANSGDDITDDAMAASAFGRGSDTAKKAKETNMDVLRLGQFNLPAGVTHFDLDTPLKDILPYEELNEADKGRGELLTARMILSHQTGLHIGALKFDFEPGSGNCGYSGVPFGYLQKVIEKLTGSTLEKLAKEFVFEPLGMTHSSFEGCGLLPMSDTPIGKKIPYSPTYIISADGIYYVADPYKQVSIDNLITNDTKKMAAFTKKMAALWEMLDISPSKQRTLLPDEQKIITSITGHTHKSHAANSLHTTASDYALFCSAWMNDKNEGLQAAFIPAVFMMKDKVINDKGKPPCKGVSQDDLKRVAYGLGWELQTDDNGDPTMAYHTGDMNEWRATVAMNLKDKTATVYFSNSHNGHILQDQIISPNGELENGLNFFRKYNFARTTEELRADWRENPSWGQRRDIPELKAEITTQLNQEQTGDVSESSISSSRRSRSVVIGAPSTSGYPRASQNNMSATNRIDSDPNKENDDTQSKSRLPNPFTIPTLKPPGHDD